MNIEKARYNMIEQQIRPWDVLDQNVLNALSNLFREQFVPDEHEHLAFADVSIPFGDIQVKPSQRLLEPKLEARLVQSLRLMTEHHVLVVGAGLGFVTALIAQLAKSVLAYEIDGLIAERARTHLRVAKIENATVKTGDGLCLDTSVLFDRILLTGSVSQVPKTLFHQLTTFGELVAVVGVPPVMQAIRFNAKGEKMEELFDTFAPALEMTSRKTFVF